MAINQNPLINNNQLGVRPNPLLPTPPQPAQVSAATKAPNQNAPKGTPSATTLGSINGKPISSTGDINTQVKNAMTPAQTPQEQANANSNAIASKVNDQLSQGNYVNINGILNPNDVLSNTQAQSDILKSQVPKTLQQQLLEKLSAATSGLSPMQQQAYDTYNKLSGSLAAGQTAIKGDVEPLPVQTGKGQILSEEYGNQLLNAGNILNEANTAQSQNIGGLESAIGATAPAPQFGVLTNPQTGQPINGQSALDAAVAGGTIQGLQSGAQTAAATGGNIQSQQQQTVATYKSALQQGQNLQSQLNDLITTFGLNPSDVNAVNTGIQKIAQNTSSPQYQVLSNYINDIANTYAQILTPTGGSQTDTTRSIASSMLNSTASGQSIMATMKALDSAAQAKIAGVPTTQTNTNSNTGGGNFTEGQTSSAGGYNFVYQGGKWVAK